MGSISGCFLALLEAVCLFCCFFSPFHCVEHTPWRKQASPSSLKALCYSSCLITNYVTPTHLNPHEKGLQTFRESDEAAKAQFTLNISQIATNHRQALLCSSGSGVMSNLVNQCPCCHCSLGKHRTWVTWAWPGGDLGSPHCSQQIYKTRVRVTSEETLWWGGNWGWFQGVMGILWGGTLSWMLQILLIWIPFPKQRN